MNLEDRIADLEEKLRQLTELRQEEEREYGRLLTLLDQSSSFALPHESAPRIGEIKDVLNRTWDVAENVTAAAQAEDRLFWNEVARTTLNYVQPFLIRQREFNSLTVHLLNELSRTVVESLSRIREFHNVLVLYFQQIIPVVDTKVREVIGIEDKNVALNLVKFHEDMRTILQNFQERTKDHVDLLFQEVDKRIETVKIDSKEHAESLRQLQISLRSLHHLANSLKEAKSKGKTVSGNQEYQYFHFEEDFRGSREEIRKKFKSYLKYFQNGVQGLVLDLGCGRGEFLELLKDAGIRGLGVDSNQEMVQQCKKLGLDVSQGDLLEFLKAQPENSLGGIFCSQVAEHLLPDYLLWLLQAAHSRLKDGAPLLLETVNVASAFGFLQVYTKDLTHRMLIHPDTLRFLVAAAGFQRPEIHFVSPVPAIAQLKLIQNTNDEATAIFNQNMLKLNRLLFDHQEYAVIATK
jgi:SAM-dependent methyltransferase